MLPDTEKRLQKKGRTADASQTDSEAVNDRGDGDASDVEPLESYGEENIPLQQADNNAGEDAQAAKSAPTTTTDYESVFQAVLKKYCSADGKGEAGTAAVQKQPDDFDTLLVFSQKLDEQEPEDEAEDSVMRKQAHPVQHQNEERELSSNTQSNSSDSVAENETPLGTSPVRPSKLHTQDVSRKLELSPKPLFFDESPRKVAGNRNEPVKKNVVKKKLIKSLEKTTAAAKSKSAIKEKGNLLPTSKKLHKTVERAEKSLERGSTGRTANSAKGHHRKPTEKRKCKINRRRQFLDRQMVKQGTWVQCDNRACHKWRYLEGVCDPSTLPAKWNCTLSNDTRYNDCDKPEQAHEKDEEKYFHTKFVEGSLVWAKLDGYPWWPAMVEEDPDNDTYFWMDYPSLKPTWYHVVFLDEKISRSWVTAVHVRHFTGAENAWDFGSTKMRGREYRPQIHAAKLNAISALRLPSLTDRIEEFGLAGRYEGHWRWPSDTEEDSCCEEGEEEQSPSRNEPPLQLHGRQSHGSCSSGVEKKRKKPTSNKHREKPKRTEINAFDCSDDEMSQLLDNAEEILRNVEDVLDSMAEMSENSEASADESDYCSEWDHPLKKQKKSHKEDTASGNDDRTDNRNAKRKGNPVKDDSEKGKARKEKKNQNDTDKEQKAVNKKVKRSKERKSDKKGETDKEEDNITTGQKKQSKNAAKQVKKSKKAPSKDNATETNAKTANPIQPSFGKTKQKFNVKKTISNPICQSPEPANTDTTSKTPDTSPHPIEKPTNEQEGKLLQEKSASSPPRKVKGFKPPTQSNVTKPFKPVHTKNASLPSSLSLDSDIFTQEMPSQTVEGAPSQAAKEMPSQAAKEVANARVEDGGASDMELELDITGEKVASRGFADLPRPQVTATGDGNESDPFDMEE
ncbi:PREDICTED: uncharacterized protein LOC106806855 [Priapulus caudatus]|uniref:Uncharacterized protein LOC106806855 n=1 Tax=Priapulus caudatus TaxID=37621 RepID=A0ABM1DX04_PRICU|nr:PREDICTED: uncharacterized protein LOC106806855 [Priapulus caudatus]